MSYDTIPDHVLNLLNSSLFTEFATVSSAGVPIDTPTFCFPGEDASSIGVATGLAYPAKAERARNNPKVGLLIEGGDDEPVISIAGSAAVHDANLQDNAERYIAETAPFRPGEAPWEQARKSVWYWTRIIIDITPVSILWWDNRAAMDAPPQRWQAPAGTVFPASDAKPPGKISPSPKWPQKSWQEHAADVVGNGNPSHLTLCDADGYPLPIRTRGVALKENGFELELPGWTPWQVAGKATLTWAGMQTFVGNVSEKNDKAFIEVERALPILPLMQDHNELWNPSQETYDNLMARLNEETSRRNQPIPTIPEQLPEPTAGAKMRLARVAKMYANQ